MDASPKDIEARLREIGISRSYACQIASGARKPSPALASRIWRETGLKFGPIQRLADETANAFSQAYAP